MFSLGAFIYVGDDLLSHTLSRAVQSAQRGLTSVFGMGTGVSPAVRSPASQARASCLAAPSPGIIPRRTCSANSVENLLAAPRNRRSLVGLKPSSG